MFLDRRCAGCRRPARLLCPRCRLVLDNCFEQAEQKVSCPARLAHLESFTAALVYDEQIATVILAAKNGGRRGLLDLLGRSLVSRLHTAPHPVGSVDAVTWVPASSVRRRRRGYDQGQVLAAVVAQQLDVPARRLLRRARHEAQANLGRESRLHGPTLRAVGPAPEGVLLVDDVAATGASLAAAANVLHAAGARRVHGAVLAAA